jgi:hypothetical protein
MGREIGALVFPFVNAAQRAAPDGVLNMPNRALNPDACEVAAPNNVTIAEGIGWIPTPATE